MAEKNARQENMRAEIVELARKELGLKRKETPSQWLSPLAVLGLSGDPQAGRDFESELLSMARQGWGIEGVGSYDLNVDAFIVKNIAECYDSVRAAGMISKRAVPAIEKWLYRFAMIRATGEITGLENFQTWNLRNQENTTGCLAEIASLVEGGPMAGELATRGIWEWVEGQLVGWRLAWRSPDDAWTYPTLWLWNAYACARARDPESLESENARRSFEWYLRLLAPCGAPLMFGETPQPGPLEAAAALCLGATLFSDGRMAYAAEKLFRWAEDHGAASPHELHRLYRWWPERIQPSPPDPVAGLIESPLPGRGWSIDQTPYGNEAKRNHPEYPGDKNLLFNYDELYQERDPEKHRRVRPDKLVFRSSWDAGSLFAAADLRAQALHDHPDALGVITVLWKKIPWVVETAYAPRCEHRQRWKHNVPLFRQGLGDAASLMTWEIDTWREVEPGDASFEAGNDLQLARARLRPESFDYVEFGGGDFEVDRAFVFAPDDLFLVIDVLTAQKDGEWSVGSMWHLRGDIEMRRNMALLSQGGESFGVSLGASGPCALHLSERQPEQSSEFYFDGPISDLLLYTAKKFRKGERIVFAAALSPREALPVKVEMEDAAARVAAGGLSVVVPWDGGASGMEVSGKP